MYLLIFERGNIDGTWANNVTFYEGWNEAARQFHGLLASYGYGNNPSYNYVACLIQTLDGAIVKSEVDNRRSEAPEVEPEGE